MTHLRGREVGDNAAKSLSRSRGLHGCYRRIGGCNIGILRLESVASIEDSLSSDGCVGIAVGMGWRRLLDLTRPVRSWCHGRVSLTAVNPSQYASIYKIRD